MDAPQGTTGSPLPEESERLKDVPASVEATSSSDVPEATSSSDVPEATSSSDVPEANTSSNVPEANTSPDVPEASTSSDVPKATSSADVPEAAEAIRPWFGAVLKFVDEKEMGQAEVPQIHLVDEGSPAHTAGLLDEDIICTWDGEAVEGADTWRDLMGGASVDQTVSLEVLRDGQRVPVAVTLGATTKPYAVVEPGDLLSG